MSDIKTCAVCDRELVADDGYLSCPYYIEYGGNEHTSYFVKEE